QRYCDETEFCLRIQRGGDHVVYAPESRVRHRIDPQRLTVQWVRRRFAAQGRSEAILQWMHYGARGLLAGYRTYRHYAAAFPVAVLRRRASDAGVAVDETLLRRQAEILTDCRRRTL